jgi:hypothetical protein
MIDNDWILVGILFALVAAVLTAEFWLVPLLKVTGLWR